MTRKQPRRPSRTLPTRSPEPGDEPQDVEAEHAGETQDAAAAARTRVPRVVTGRRPVRQFVSDLKTTEQQVGEHIIEALQDPGTVAVLTAVVIGPDGVQRIVSAALDPDQLLEVQKLMHVAEEEREEEEPCVGFHCLLKQKEPRR